MAKHSTGSGWDRDEEDAAEASSLRATLDALWRETRTAAHFFTRLPLPGDGPPDTDLSQAARTFPLLGAAIGAAGGIVILLAAGLGLPPLAAALLALGAVCAITGAMHEAELAAAAEGFCAGPDLADRREAMRERRPGVPGVLALVFTLGLRVAALAGIAGPLAAAGALIAACAASRGVLPYLHHRLPPAPDAETTAPMGRPPREAAVIAALLGGLFVLLFLGPVSGLLALLLAAGAAAGVAALAMERTGGMTGAASGAAQQAVETAVLLVAVATA